MIMMMIHSDEDGIDDEDFLEFDDDELLDEEDLLDDEDLDADIAALDDDIADMAAEGGLAVQNTDHRALFPNISTSLSLALLLSLAGFWF